MPRLNIKYKIGRDNCDGNIYLHHEKEFQNVPRNTTLCIQGSKKLLLIPVYFVLSVGLTFYQKHLYKSYGKYPLTVVICHLVVKFFLSALIRMYSKYMGQSRVKLQWHHILCTLGPPGIASGLDIGLSNWSLSLIVISLYTMTKSTTIIFILGFSLFFHLEKKSWSLVCIVILISSGLIMFTYKSTQFQLLGFILSLLASFLSGLRWTMSQIIMQKSKLGMKNTVDLIYYMQPWMLVSVLPITIWFEGEAIYDVLTKIHLSKRASIMYVALAVVGGAFLAFGMEVSEFLVVTYTSSLTLSISGIFKEICILILAFEWQNDQMSTLNFVGLLMCLGGIILHIIQKVMMQNKESNESFHLQTNPSETAGKSDNVNETNIPLLNEKSTSFTNLINTNLSSEEDDESKEINSQTILSDILQRREL